MKERVFSLVSSALRASLKSLGPLAIILIMAAFAVISGGGAALAQDQGAARPGATPGTPGSIVIPEPPILALEAFPAYGPAPLTVGFLLNAVDPEDMGIAAYNWNFGDGNVSTLPPTLTYNTYKKAGTYIVTVTAVTIDGRSASAFTGVVVKPPATR